MYLVIIGWNRMGVSSWNCHNEISSAQSLH
nr:MAG TPA: hypothetical protein [Caudoviricetes sp.]